MYLYIHILIHISIYISLSLYIYIYIYIIIGTRESRRAETPRISLEGTKGSQGMGVVSSNWFDHILLSIIFMFKPSC